MISLVGRVGLEVGLTDSQDSELFSEGDIHDAGYPEGSLDGTDHVSRAVQTASPPRPHLSPSVASRPSSDGPLCSRNNLTMTGSQGWPADGDSPVGCLLSASWSSPSPRRPAALTPSSSWRSETGISDVFPRVEREISSSPAPLSSFEGSPDPTPPGPALHQEARISVYPGPNILQRYMPFASEADCPVANSGTSLANTSRVALSDWNPVSIIGVILVPSYTC